MESDSESKLKPIVKDHVFHSVEYIESLVTFKN